MSTLKQAMDQAEKAYVKAINIKVKLQEPK